MLAAVAASASIPQQNTCFMPSNSGPKAVMNRGKRSPRNVYLGTAPSLSQIVAIRHPGYGYKHEPQAIFVRRQRQYRLSENLENATISPCPMAARMIRTR